MDIIFFFPANLVSVNLIAASVLLAKAFLTSLRLKECLPFDARFSTQSVIDK